MTTLPETSSLVVSTPEWAAGCQTCKDIWHQFADPETAPAINLGSYEEALSTTCPNHRALVQSFIDFCQFRGAERFKNDDVGFRKPYKGCSIDMTQSVSKGGYMRSLLLAKDDQVPNHPGNGRLLDPDFADIETAKKWKHRCLSSHGAKCENPFKIWPARPAWLVDVQNKCIVPGQTSGTYVAISYTYGDYTQPNITPKDFARLQEPFALEATELSQFVSPIIRHAMYLTSAIDERYLWADALCVIHHDRKTASEQLQLMGAIYANAIVTIVATDGDSGSGILGLKDLSNSREISQERIPFGDETVLVRNTSHLDTMTFFLSRRQPYYTRGWTFQEYALAKRKIIFNNNELHWVCACSVWHEELTLYTEIDHELGNKSHTMMAGFPDDLSLSQYLETYNRRSLTFDEDALPALSGLLSVFSRSFEGGFLYGIPEMFFEYSLCWRSFSTWNLQRRIPSGRPTESQFASSGLPSWSWLGWKGYVMLRCQSSIQVGTTNIEEAFPITEWYTSDSPCDPPERRRRIQSTWYEKREGFKDFTKPMPPGWTRREAVTIQSPDNKPRLHPDGCGKYIFEHEAGLQYNGAPLEWVLPISCKGDPGINAAFYA